VGDRPADLFEVGVYGFPLASSVYQAAFFEMFGLRLWSWRLSSVAAVLASLVPLYFLVRAMYGRAIAALTLLLFTTSPFLLAFARSGYNNIQAVLPLTVALCLVYAAVERDSRTLFFVSGAAAGLGFYTYFAAQISIVILAAFLLHAVWTRRLSTRDGSDRAPPAP
jgi:4-amino-4-deoxy-L-arabinose transferase-like glycosyltransferase